MIRVGLTGGIGSGKTTVAKLFKELGIPVYNSDKEAKKLMRSSAKVRKAVTELLGEEAYTKKKINRKYIATKVFGDPELLQALNAIVHPAVKKHFNRWENRQKAPYVIQEAAILFENGSYKHYDKMILVQAPEKIRIARIMKRDGSSEEEILARMKNQWSDTDKREFTHYVIDNTDLEKTKNKVTKIHRELLKISGQR